MPRPPRPWFRFYSEATESLKVHELPDRLVKPWLFMLCMANTNKPRGRLPSPAKVAFALRVKEEKAKGLIAELVTRKFIDYDGAHYVMHEWDEFQADRDIPAGKRGDKTQVGHANDAETPRVSHDRGEEEKDVEKELEKDVEEEREEEPPAHPFTLTYVRRFQERNAGQRPKQTEHAAALAIEREYGSGPCIELGNDLDWSKHPNYMRPILEERKNGKPRLQAVGSGNGRRSGSSTIGPAEINDLLAWQRGEVD